MTRTVWNSFEDRRSRERKAHYVPARRGSCRQAQTCKPDAVPVDRGGSECLRSISARPHSYQCQVSNKESPEWKIRDYPEAFGSRNAGLEKTFALSWLFGA